MISMILLDIIYIPVFLYYFNKNISVGLFFITHTSAILIATMVMYTGVGAGALWIPILTLCNVAPSESVSISIFTQIAGKGIGSINYLREGLVELKIVKYLLPYALFGTLIGYITGFFITLRYERVLIYIFVCVVAYLLYRMLQTLNEESNDTIESTHVDIHFNRNELKKSKLVAIGSSFFTGLLSIGNTDWLIPHMERDLKIPTRRSIATGLFIMFMVSLFYLMLSFGASIAGIRHWPEQSYLLFSTCSGVIIGGHLGTYLIKFSWFRKHQKHAFILMLSLSIIHILW